ncbi:hypothetical protein BDW59DRAFT_158470 [Aspergillus cavernicola]|uniref:CFEM domain-containing protein n=1 Tax=Aspergillus cavernicola TaxID=176166 RepID=A0ABR4IS07_9EURO
MKLYQTIIVLLSTSLAQGQILDLPNCSLSCFLNSMAHDGCPSLTDFACHCRQPALVTQVRPCVQKACNQQDQSAVSNAVVTQCSSVGVPISIPPVSGSATQSNPTASGDSTALTTETTATASEPAVTPPTSTPSVESSTPVGSSSYVPSSTSPIQSSNPPASSSPFDGGAGSLNYGGKLAGAAAAVAARYLL